MGDFSMAITLSVPTESGEFVNIKVPEPGDVTIGDLVKMVYEKITIILVHNWDNTKTWLVPVTPNCEPDIPVSAIRANAMEIISTGKTLGELDVTAITQNFWTCKCKRNFVHHKILWECPECQLTVREDQNRLPYLNELITWNLYVE